MEIGSLVEALHTFVFRPGTENVPIKGNIYTVRGIRTSSGSTGIVLEEIINPVIQFLDLTGEVHFWIERFREIQPPMTIDISELQHQTEKV
jgi:hypothetical protein